MSDVQAVTPGLIYDLGMNNGDDTGFYLKRGFDVVAVEANPELCQMAEARFAEAIAAGKLTIIKAAIGDHDGEVTFHVNLDNHHWSSTDINWAGRDDSACEAITVASLSLASIYARHGVPHFMKIDVEGADLMVLEQLVKGAALPDFVSIEDCRFGFDYARILSGAGYQNFQLVDQSAVGGSRDPVSGHVFPTGSSGLFGPDLPGTWEPYPEFVETYATTVRTREGVRLAPRTRWWDIHASRHAQHKEKTP
jgi:FkbM family methyltransferase